ncbi:MAG TPA: hypothetical protein VMV09_00975, partial [Candidatus Saccharimonadales bacterium]|nr:hypothetical protein [Candidatus Saccharimonadales bacterium]
MGKSAEFRGTRPETRTNARVTEQSHADAKSTGAGPGSCDCSENGRNGYASGSGGGFDGDAKAEAFELAKVSMGEVDG